MKVTGLQDVYFALNDERYEITLDQEIIDGARLALQRMMDVPRDN
jgi:quinolinate synthase